MIKVNGTQLKLDHFPDGTLHLIPDFEVSNINSIDWFYENEEELVALIYITNYLKDNISNRNILYMYYICNARMDRIKNSSDVFTLKYFSQIINYLGFEKVMVLDPHSSVSEALINNMIKFDLHHLMNVTISEVKKYANKEDIIVYFPDNGAAKKYEDLFEGYRTCYGIKHRDWETGQITELEVITNGLDIQGKTVLMVDDIISYGGSMYFGALELRKLGVKNTYAYASHTENSILDKEKGTLIKLLEDGTVEQLFTTDSLFTGSHEKISVMKL